VPFRVLGWVCGVLFVGLLWVLSCTVLFSLFPFSIKLLITYQKNKLYPGSSHILDQYILQNTLTYVLLDFLSKECLQ
jgi:hypothetical protein